MLKTPTKLIIAFGLLLAPLLATPQPTPCPTARGCGLPEPSAVPELSLCLAGIAVAYWLLSRNRKPIP